MKLMRSATRAIFLHFHATGVISTVFHGGVVAFFTLGASQMNDWSDIFFL
jgi:hypothetical protein